ncbi:hypothetical protein [Acetobacter sacchari]|uniref:hypothetical protein n=1 Tax=Acetobacter sacchari TaxID=2661687 RepID=UPI001A9F186E|nr:hypothetical protein [Acetobacter sacchari]
MSETSNSNTLTDIERVNVRRYCWYPAFGSENVGFSSWRFFDHYGQLEFRLTNLSMSEISVVRGMLSTLVILEAGPSDAANQIDTDKAAIWTRNKDEVKDRVDLYNQQRLELVQFLGIPPGPARSTFSVRLNV